MPHKCLCCQWGIQGRLVGPRLGPEISTVLYTVMSKIIKEYKNYPQKTVIKNENNLFAYPLLTLLDLFVCWLRGFPGVIVEFGLGSKISTVLWTVVSKIIEEYKN